MSELPYMKAEREAAERVARELAKPDMQDRDYGADESEFDPWELFPTLYGSYSSQFDDLAIEVLENIAAKEFGKKEALAHEMFREMLCTASLCTYGTSPRVCFATQHFEPLLPQLIARWTLYRDLFWGDAT
jgi:hypothetical protein